MNFKDLPLKKNTKRKHTPSSNKPFTCKKRRRVKKLPAPRNAHDLMSVKIAMHSDAEFVQWPYLLANCSAAIDEYIQQQPEEIRDFLGEKVRLATVHWTCNRCHRDVLLLCLSWRLSTC